METKITVKSFKKYGISYALNGIEDDLLFEQVSDIEEVSSRYYGDEFLCFDDDGD